MMNLKPTNNAVECAFAENISGLLAFVCAVPGLSFIWSRKDHQWNQSYHQVQRCLRWFVENLWESGQEPASAPWHASSVTVRRGRLT